MEQNFHCTKSVVGSLELDERNKLFKICGLFGGRVYKYSNLLNFELIEDGNTVTRSGGLRRAIVGGALFGPAGAIVGGVTRKKKGTVVCKSLRIRLSLKDVNPSTEYINFINSKTKTDSWAYDSSKRTAEECISLLEIIASENNIAGAQTVTVQATSAADEILKFKKLMDAGIITPSEFERKKKELLSL